MKKKKDYLLFTLFFQFAVCLLLFSAIFGLKQINSDIYYAVKDDYFAKINENIIVEEIEPTTELTKEKEDIITDNKSKDTVKTENLSMKSEQKNDLLTVKIDKNSTNTYKTDNIDKIPANVCVNSYTLNQNMVVPVNGKITSPFGVRLHPISNVYRFHAGVDIAASQGTPIYAAFSGKVAEVKYDEWNGNYLKLSHDGNVTTVYCHCEKITVAKGDSINAGDVVGYVGSTGSSTGPHLHFEFRVNNISYDPQNALSEAINAV